MTKEMDFEKLEVSVPWANKGFGRENFIATPKKQVAFICWLEIESVSTYQSV
jgi:hypothetical protein